MVTTLSDTGETPMDVVGNAYTYDQLNRLIMKNAYVRAGMHLPGNDNWTGVSVTTNYKEKFIYDSNGNILSLLRYAEGTNPMDNLTYHYNPGTNQLQFVDDAIADGDYTVDIDDQDTLNYSYDKNGNLVFDAAEEIDTIRWTVSGKIEAVIRASASTKPSLYFYYDALGNRSIKQVVPASGTQNFEFYKRDATGNILATYKMADSSGTKILKLEQREIYGSSRLGVITQEVRIAENASWPNVTPSYDTANAPFVLWNTDSTYLDSVFINPFDSVGYKIKVNKYLGYRNYELSNHLGNVLAVISDRKYGEDADTDGQLELFKPNVLSESDYYAFGSEVKERSVSGGYKFGFNGQMKDNEIYGEGNANTAMFWEYDTRLGRRWNLDQAMNPNQSNYSAFNNSPYFFNDIYGDDVDISKIYEKDKNGSYKNKANILAFELYASTKAGKKYILDHAEKGFKLNGVFIKNLNISAEVEGKSSKNGVDVSFNPYNDNPWASGTTRGEIKNNRLKISISLDNLGSLNKLSEMGELRDKMLSGVETIGHETFTHAEIKEKEFLGFGFQRESNDQHDYKLISQTSYLTNIMYDSKTGYKGSEQFILNSKAVNMLNEVQNMNIHMNLGQKKYSQKELFNKFISGGFLWKGLK